MPDFKLGRKPGVIPVGLRDLTYYVAGSLPRPPSSVKVPQAPPQTDGTLWGMLGNDQYGDCGVAGLEHGFMVSAADTSERESFPDTDQAVSYYLAYDDYQDEGVVLSEYLGYVKQHGYYGHKVAAYAPVSVNDIPTLQFATDAYDFTYTGIAVYQGMLDAAQGDPPWTWTADDLGGDIVGGHCIPVVAYDSNYLYAITWGQTVRIAYPAWHLIASEAWAVITGEAVAHRGGGHGINLTALEADLSKLAK